MSNYETCADDFYVNVNLATELDLPQNRESVLGFFERLQKQFPSMRNFYCRERGEMVLEEDKDSGSYRWVAVEPKRLSSGFVNPESVEQALEHHRVILDLAPYMLSLSRLDCESLTVLFGFDFTYRGNHNKLLCEALGLPPAYEKLAELPGVTPISYEPFFQFAVQSDCRMQIRVGVEPRTSAYHVRTSEYPEEQLSVFVSAKRYGALNADESFVTTIDQLAEFGREVVDNHVVEHVLRPLQHAITIR